MTAPYRVRLPILHDGDVVDAQDAAVRGFQHDLFKVLRGLDRALRPDHERLFALVQPSGPVVPVVRGDGFGEIGYAEAGRGHFCAVGQDFENADITAERIDIGDAGNGAQRRPDRPIEQSALLLKGQPVSLDREHEDIR